VSRRAGLARAQRWGALLLAGLCAATSGLAGAAAYEVTPEVARGRLGVPVHLNGIGPYPFLLDAAISRPVIDSTVATYAGLENLGALGTDAARTAVSRFQYGGLPAHEERAAVMDLSGLGMQLGRPVAGLLPAWRPGLELEVLAAVPKVIWRELGSNTLEEAGGAVVRLTLESGGLPTVPVYVNGKPAGALAIDFQYGGVAVLPREAFGLEGQSGLIRIDQGHGAASSLARVEEVRVGLAALLQPVCQIAQDGEQPRLGMGFFRHCAVRLNFEYGLARFENADGTPEAEDFTGCGLLPLRQEDGFWRLGVVEQSPAALAGAEAGDQLISVDRESLEGAPYELALSLLNEGSHERIVRLHRPRTGAFFDLSLAPTELL